MLIIILLIVVFGALLLTEAKKLRELRKAQDQTAPSQGLFLQQDGHRLITSAVRLGDEIKLAPRARRAGILIEVRLAKGKPLSRKYLAHKLNTAEATIKHDIEWLIKEGRLQNVKHVGNKGAIYKTQKAQS